jgi:ubiquinol-cytochrome c reductase cytochrome c subunit
MFRPAPRSLLMMGLALTLQLRCGGTSAARDSAAPIYRGEMVYNSKGCYTCHGRVGQGSIYTGPSLASLRLSAEALAGYVRAPSGVMPGYSAAMVSDDELRAIAAYLLSLPPSPSPSRVPLLAPYTVTSGR